MFGEGCSNETWSDLAGNLAGLGGVSRVSAGEGEMLPWPAATGGPVDAVDGRQAEYLDFGFLDVPIMVVRSNDTGRRRLG